MANAEKDWKKMAEFMSGWCAGCGTRLEKDTPKTLSVYVPDSTSKQALYLICNPCCEVVVNHLEGYEKILERVEQRAKLYFAVDNTKGGA